MASSYDPFKIAIETLRMTARGHNPNPVDAYAQRANGAYPTWKEMQGRMEQEIASQQAAGQRYMEGMDKPLDRRLPWLHFAAGMMKPTRTGAIGEAVGQGLEGLAMGRESLQKHAMDAEARKGNIGFGMARDRLSATQGMFQLGLGSQQLDASLEMLRDRLMTPHERFALEQGAVKGDKNWDRLVDISRFMTGLSGDQLVWAKNMWANNPGITAPQLAAKAARQQIKEGLRKDPRFSGGSFSDPATAARMLEEETDRLFNEQYGAPGGARPPAAAPRPAPSSVPAQPGASAVPVAADAPMPEHLAGIPWAKHLQHPPGSQRVPSYLNPMEKEIHLARVKNQDTAGQELYSKTIAPTADSAAEAQAAVMTQASILGKDPNLTGFGKETAARIASVFEGAGMAPKGWAERVTNWQEFDSFVKKGMLAEQTKQTGVQTEGDAQRIQQTLAAMGKTPQANHFILRYLNAAATRLMERERFFSAYNEMHGTYHGANARWMEYVRKNPLVREVESGGKKAILFDTDGEYRSYKRELDAQQPRPRT